MNGESVKLTIPAKAEYLVMLRLVASAIGGQADFDVDDIEDLKTACSEACLLLIARAKKNTMLEVEFYVQEGVHAIIDASVDEAAERSPESEISMFLLEALADEVEFTEKDGKSTCELFKAPFPA
ncbi:hypothetical protein LJC07_07035 [Christensenellaceae bacterium OttesenSCG-928-L17]|nr:hypothetical protein [Christensenellaceae bacterium OttesenSCG-928-L17]